LKGEGFNLAFNGAVKLDLYLTDFRQGQPITTWVGHPPGVRQLETGLLERETVVPAQAFESRIAILMTGLNSPKKSLKSQINPLLNMLQNLRMNLIQFWLRSLPERQKLVGIVQAQGLLLTLPDPHASGQGFIINPPAKLKCLVKLRSLRFSWVKSILECFTHNRICVNYSKNVLFSQNAKAKGEALISQG
jgi:hypothetical protein